VKYWPKNVDPVSCPECSTPVIPEFERGFFRIPRHDDGKAEPDWKIDCKAIGSKVIA
jgi:hypothetical protein